MIGIVEVEADCLTLATLYSDEVLEGCLEGCLESCLESVRNVENFLFNKFILYSIYLVIINYYT